MVLLSVLPDAGKVSAALRELARDMGDPYLMEDALVAKALATGVAGAVLAEDTKGAVGVALYSPFLSTTRGKMGALVTDLWVDQAQRGSGLGRRLLALVRDETANRWGGSFLRLNHYEDNQGAAAFYGRLGFKSRPQEIWVTLEGAELAAL